MCTANPGSTCLYCAMPSQDQYPPPASSTPPSVGGPAYPPPGAATGAHPWGNPAPGGSASHPSTPRTAPRAAHKPGAVPLRPLGLGDVLDECLSRREVAQRLPLPITHTGHVASSVQLKGPVNKAVPNLASARVQCGYTIPHGGIAAKGRQHGLRRIRSFLLDRVHITMFWRDTSVVQTELDREVEAFPRCTK